MGKQIETPESRLAAVRNIDPGCVTKGRTVTFLNPTRNDKDRGSCSMNLDTGLFTDFAAPKFKGTLWL
jgi:hypothetical protein